MTEFKLTYICSSIDCFSFANIIMCFTFSKQLGIIDLYLKCWKTLLFFLITITIIAVQLWSSKAQLVWRVQGAGRQLAGHSPTLPYCTAPGSNMHLLFIYYCLPLFTVYHPDAFIPYFKVTLVSLRSFSSLNSTKMLSLYVARKSKYLTTKQIVC